VQQPLVNNGQRPRRDSVVNGSSDAESYYDEESYDEEADQEDDIEKKLTEKELNDYI
jgi:hypothetical protein